MTSSTHSRKTSLHYQLGCHKVQSQNENQLGFIKSLNESPQAGSVQWLRSTHCGRNDRYRSDEKSTDKVTTLRDMNENGRSQLFVLNNHVAKTRPLTNFSNLSLESALYVVQSAIKQCFAHHQRSGGSYFSIKHCYVNQQNKLIINSNNPYSHAYSPISDETIVVRDIIESVHKISAPKCFDDFYSYYKRTSVKNKCDFKYALSLIKSYCTCAKVTVNSVVKTQDSGNFRKVLDSSQHPRSAEKTSPFARLPPWVNRRKSTYKGYRESVYRKVFDSHSRQKDMNNTAQSKRGPLKTQPQIISIQEQYNVVVTPLNECDNSNRKSSVKVSTVSTSFRSSQNGDSLEVSNINLHSRLLGTCHKPYENKEYFSFLPKDLDQVQSLGESSDQQSLLPTRRFETPKDDHLQNIKKQNQDRILTINNWTRKLNGLLEQERDLKESITEEAGKENEKFQRRPQKLKMLVRTVAESILPIPSQFYIQNS